MTRFVIFVKGLFFIDTFLPEILKKERDDYQTKKRALFYLKQLLKEARTDPSSAQDFFKIVQYISNHSSVLRNSINTKPVSDEEDIGYYTKFKTTTGDTVWIVKLYREFTVGLNREVIFRTKDLNRLFAFLHDML